MAMFNPDEYKDEFVVPEGQYELYFSSQEIRYGKESGVPYLAMTTIFVDGPRQGKGFDHAFFIFNEDAKKRKQALTWFGNFCRAIDLGAFDPETEGEKMLNKTFIGDVTVDENPGYQPKNKLLPWGFHKVGGDPKPSTSTSASGSSAASSASKSSEPYDDDIPF